MTTDRPDLKLDGHWPAVRLFGSDVAVVSVNSSRPNPQPWRSSGKIPEPQLDGLRKVLADPDIASRFVFIMTHYAPRLANGQPDSWDHGLVNADEFLEVCSTVKRGAILCGHVHKCFRVRVPGLGPEIFCGGSATINQGGGFWVFDMNGTSMTPRRGERLRALFTDRSVEKHGSPKLHEFFRTPCRTHIENFPHKPVWREDYVSSPSVVRPQHRSSRSSRIIE